MDSKTALNKPERNINIDLIRCVALFIVPLMHGLDNTALYLVRLTGFTNIFMMVMRIGITISIPCYIMITGYLCHRKSFSARYYLGYVRILLVYLLCSIPCAFLEYYYKHSYDSLRSLIGSIINFSCCGYAWYLLMYTGLFLMIPFLNMMYHGCATKRQKQVLVLTFFALSILPSLLNTYIQIYSLWWERLYPICYYFTGAYLNEYMPRKSPRKLAASFFGFLAAYSIFFYFNYNADGGKLCDVYQTSWEVYVMGVMIFIWLANLNTEHYPRPIKKAILKISDLTLIIYMLTWISDGLLYTTMARNIPGYWSSYKWLLISVPTSFISATLFALLLDKLYQPLYKWSMARLTALLKL